MLPLIREKTDLLEIQRKGTERFKKYDVVLYKADQQYILHRIVNVKKDSYITAGDHNAYLEYGIADSQIIGVLKRIIRNGKSIQMDSKMYLLYSHLWCFLFPVRKMLICCGKALSTCKHHGLNVLKKAIKMCFRLLMAIKKLIIRLEQRFLL